MSMRYITTCISCYLDGYMALNGEYIALAAKCGTLRKRSQEAALELETYKKARIGEVLDDKSKALAGVAEESAKLYKCSQNVMYEYTFRNKFSLVENHAALAVESANLYKRSQEAALVLTAYDAGLGWPHANMPLYIMAPSGEPPSYHVKKEREVQVQFRDFKKEMHKVEADLTKLLWLRGRELAIPAKSALEECFRVQTGGHHMQDIVYMIMQMSLFSESESSAPTPDGARSHMKKKTLPLVNPSQDEMDACLRDNLDEMFGNEGRMV